MPHRYIGNCNSKIKQGKAPEGFASGTALWLERYSKFGDETPPDVEGGVMPSNHAWQTTFMVSQPSHTACPSAYLVWALAVPGIMLTEIFPGLLQ